MTHESTITNALRWLIGEVSASLYEFRAAHQPGGDELLDGLVGNGYVLRRGNRVAVTDAGRARAA